MSTTIQILVLSLFLFNSTHVLARRCWCKVDFSIFKENNRKNPPILTKTIDYGALAKYKNTQTGANKDCRNKCENKAKEKFWEEGTGVVHDNPKVCELIFSHFPQLRTEPQTAYDFSARYKVGAKGEKTSGYAGGLCNRRCPAVLNVHNISHHVLPLLTASKEIFGSDNNLLYTEKFHPIAQAPIELSGCPQSFLNQYSCVYRASLPGTTDVCYGAGFVSGYNLGLIGAAPANACPPGMLHEVDGLNLKTVYSHTYVNDKGDNHTNWFDVNFDSCTSKRKSNLKRVGNANLPIPLPLLVPVRQSNRIPASVPESEMYELKFK